MSADKELEKAIEEARRKSEELIQQVLNRVERVVSELKKYSDKDPEAMELIEKLRSGEIDSATAERKLEEIRRRLEGQQ